MGRLAEVIKRTLDNEGAEPTDPAKFGDTPAEVVEAAHLLYDFARMFAEARKDGFSPKVAATIACYAQFMVGFDIGRVFEREQNADTRSTDPAA